MEKIRFITDVYNRIIFAPERNTLWFCFYMVRENVEMTMKLN